MARAQLTQLEDLGTHLAELLIRKGAEPPALLELALLAARSDDNDHVRKLLGIAGQIEDYWGRSPATVQWPSGDAPWQQAHRHLAGIVNALGKALPEPVAAPPARGDELRVRLRSEWLIQAAIAWQDAGAFSDPIFPAAAGAESCSLHALLVDQGEGRGQIAKLTLHLMPAERAHLQFAAMPTSALTPCTAEFLSAMDDATNWLRSITQPVATRDFALGWDFAPVGGRILGLHGRSAGAALALGAAWLVRTWVNAEALRAGLHRVRPGDLVDAPVSATIEAGGKLGRVGGVVFKAPALRPYVQSRAWQGTTVSMYVSSLQDGLAGDELNALGVYVDPCESMAELIGRIAARHPLTPAQQSLLCALLEGEPKSDDPVQLSDLTLRQVVHSPVTTVGDFLLHRWALWAQEPEGQLHVRFVPLQLEPDPAALAPGTEVSPGRYKGVADLLKTNDRSGLHAFMLRGEPGAGKSTLMQHHEQWLCRKALRQVHAGEPVAELPLYLPLAGLPEDADPLAWARDELHKAHPQCHELHALLRRDRQGHDQLTKLRVMLDGLNELPVSSVDRRRGRAQQVVHAIWQGLRPGLPMLLGARAHHGFDFKARMAGVPALYVVPADVLPWGNEEILAYLRCRFPQPGKAEALWNDLRRHPQTLAMCRVPINLVGQCDLLEAGVARLVTDRADLYRRWLWQRLQRELGKAQANQDESPFYDDELLTPDDRETLLAPGVLAQERMPPWPRGGCLLGSMFRQGLAQWRQSAASDPGVPSAARGEVQVDWDSEDQNRSVVNWLAPALRLKWRRAVQELGLAHLSPDRQRFKWRHQSWGEYLASVELLRLPPTQMAAADRDQLFKELQPPALQTRDIDELRHLRRQTDENWGRVQPAFWQQLLSEGITLPRSDVEAAMRRGGYQDHDFDHPDGVWQVYLRNGLITEHGGPAPTVRANLQRWGDAVGVAETVGAAVEDWPQSPAAWQVLITERLWSRFESEVWRRLGLQLGEDEARALRDRPGRLELPSRGDLDEVLTLALLGLADAGTWLGELLAQGLWQPASAALPVLAGRPEGSGRPPEALLQQLRRVLLLRSVGAGRGVHQRLAAGGVIAALEQPFGGLPQPLQDHCKREWKEAFSSDGHDLRHRLQAGLLLGEVGDTLRYERVSVALADGGTRGGGMRLRRRHWIGVGTAGRQTVFRIGSDKPDPSAIDNEQPPFDVPLPYFEVAAYPVTVGEWQAFVDCGGYDDAEAAWWRTAGAAAQAWLQERQAKMKGRPVRPLTWGWSDWSNPLQPVTGVTAHEALAYAAWAAVLYQGPGWDDGLAPALPTEVQWEAAVRGPAQPGKPPQQRWPHPGPADRPGPLDFNHSRTRWLRPSPVGVFSSGLTAQGVADAAGNVWEWCSNARPDTEGWTAAAQRQANTHAAPADGVTPRALRGGSYDNRADRCRAGYRSRGLPGLGSNDGGLRLVRCVLPHSEP